MPPSRAVSDEAARAAASSTFAVGVVAIVVTRRRRLPRLHEVDPVPPALRGQGRVQERQQHQARLAGADRRRRGRQGHEGRARAQGRRGRGRDDARSTTTAGRCTRTRSLKIRPRIFLEGNFFVDLTPGTPSARARRRRTSSRSTQTATPVQLDQVLTALQTDTREDLQTLLREYAAGLTRQGRARASTARSRTGSRPTATRRSSPRRCSARREHDLSGYIDRAGVVAGALDRNRGQLKALITTSADRAARSRARTTSLRGRDRRAAAHAARRASPRSTRSTRAFPDAARLRPRLRPGVRVSGPTIDASLPLVAPAARPRLASPSCAA